MCSFTEKGIVQLEVLMMFPLFIVLFAFTLYVTRGFDAGVRAVDALRFYALERWEGTPDVSFYSLEGESWKVETSDSRRGNLSGSLSASSGDSFWRNLMDAVDRISGARKVSLNLRTPHLPPVGSIDLSFDMSIYLDPMKDSSWRAWIPRGVAVAYGVIRALAQGGLLGEVGKEVFSDVLERSGLRAEAERLAGGAPGRVPSPAASDDLFSDLNPACVR